TLGQGGCSHASAARCSGTAAQSARTLADDSGSLRRGQTSLSTNVRAAKRKPGTNRSNSEGYRQAFGHPLTQNVRHPLTLGSPEQLVRERRLRFSYEAFGFVHDRSPSAPISNCSTSALNSWRARRKREATVPRGIPSISAISGLDSPSNSKRTNTLTSVVSILLSTRSIN